MHSRLMTLLLGAILALAVQGASAGSEWQGQTSKSLRDRNQPPRIVEIRSYNLKAGTRDRFHQLFVTRALPMLHRWNVDVVTYGPSLHDADSYYLMRAYASVEERQRSEDAFYGSEEWRQGPREAILACIDSYTTVVIRLDDATLQGLRKAGDVKVEPASWN
jgi:hypothetical protein